MTKRDNNFNIKYMEPDKSIISDALNYFKIDLNEAEKGAKRFGETFSKLKRETQRDLSTQEQAFGELASFSVGIKPAVMIKEGAIMEFANKFTEGSDEASIIGNFLVWNEKAKEVIKANADVFTDFEDTTDPRAYLEKTLIEKDVQNKDFKLGLLLGYPKEASELHAKNIDAYVSFFRTVYSDIIGPGMNNDPKIVQFFRDFVHDGTRDDIQRSNKFRDSHQSEAYDLIKGLDVFKDYTDEQIKYICNTRGVQSKGLSYMGVAGTDSYEKAPKYVDQIFSISGLDSEINKINEDLQRIEYKSDYPTAVKAVSGTIASMLSSHMMYGIMQNDPGLKIKAEFKELREQLTTAVEFSKEHWPGKDVNQFEKDFMQGFDTISQAILKAINERDGIYMAGSLRNVSANKDLNWIAKESLEILNNAGFDIAPILAKVNSSPNIEEAKAEDIFESVFPISTNL